MAQAATGGAPSGATGGGNPGVGQNPFQICTNLYAEKNLQGLQSALNVTASQQQFGGSINAGQFLRGLRLMVRSSTPGTFTVINGRTVGTQTDGAFDLIANADLINVDGSEILYNMSAYSHYIMEKYAKPWKKDRALAYDYQPPVSTTSIGCFTLPLAPEIRWTAGVLANTDTRSQYRFDYTVSAVTSTVTPAINVTPYMDAWAQPDANDLQGTPNQPVPPGVNLQVKRRHQLFSINSGADNTILSTLTGNAIRCAAIIARNTASNSVRVDGFSDPIYWYLDNRSLGRLNPDIVRQWAEDQYTTYDLYGVGNPSYATNPNFYGAAPGVVDGLAASSGAYTGAPSVDFGVAIFPRFIEPGELFGQGWLYTANSTKLAWETVAANSANQYELVVDEVYPVGNVDPSLVDI
jgi:hypothetical protein